MKSFNKNLEGLHYDKLLVDLLEIYQWSKQFKIHWKKAKIHKLSYKSIISLIQNEMGSFEMLTFIPQS